MNRRDYISRRRNELLKESLDEKAERILNKLKGKFDYVEGKGEMCNECGGQMYENECMECGYSGRETMEDVDPEELEVGKHYRNPNRFKNYEKEDVEFLQRVDYPDMGGRVKPKPHFIFKDRKSGEHSMLGDEDVRRMRRMDEKLSYKQKKHLDQNDDDVIDELDFEILHSGGDQTKEREKTKRPGEKEREKDRTKKPRHTDPNPDVDEKPKAKKERDESECKECGSRGSDTIYEIKVEEDDMKEGNAFVFAKKRAEKRGDKNFEFDGKTYPVKESVVRFTESELIHFIENLVTEEKFKKGQTPPGYTAYEKSFKGSGKENKEAMNDTTKRMREYNKLGSKGGYETNPKHFPKGNGQLEKMSKKAYVMSKDGNEFLDDYMRPGMEDLVPEEITYDQNWVSDNIKGSSRTGNNPEWANAEETELGQKLVKKQQAKKFHKAKETAYRKSKQPVTDGTGENSGTGVNIKLENVAEKETQKLFEEFDRMKNLISYDRKTQ
jgi:hypothetical protein